MSMTISKRVRPYREDIVAWRRDFHAHPELGFEEVRTSGIVAQALASFGLPVRTDFCAAKTAVIATLRTGRPGRTVALRADMDALPMEDEKDVPYRSQNPGVCHACGHDGHTACLLGVAKYCAEHPEEFSGTLHFVFQPAEEGPAPGGAKLILESGALEDVDYMLGAHQGTYVSVGQVLVRFGTACSGGDGFTVTLDGVGTHAVSPQDGSDVIFTAAQIIQGWQGTLARRVDPQQPAVLSVCSIQAGEPGTRNVLPAHATFSGTLRTFSDPLRKRIIAMLQEQAQSIAQAGGCTCSMQVDAQFPVLENHPVPTQVVQRAAQQVVGEQQVILVPEPNMGSEDFAYYAKRIPSSYFMYGVRNDAKGITYGGHHPKFDLDEDALLIAMDVFLSAAKELLELPV